MSACANCRVSKCRCDARERIPCSRCERLGLQCVTTPPRGQLEPSHVDTSRAQERAVRTLSNDHVILSMPPPHPAGIKHVEAMAYVSNMFNDRELMEKAFIPAGALNINVKDFKRVS